MAAVDASQVRLHVNEYRQIHLASPVVYHSGLAALAQANAERLLTEGVNATRSPTNPDNVLFFSSTLNDDTALVKTAVDAWYSTFKNYDFSKPGSVTQQTQQFTKLVWRDTRRIGAGVAKSNSEKGVSKTVVVDMRFDPVGNRPDQFSANVLPRGVDHLVFQDYYTKKQSDDRFLSVDGLSAYKSVVENAAVAAASNRVASVQTTLQTDYFTKLQVQDKFVGFPQYESFCNLVRNDYYVKSAVEAKIANASSNLTSNLSGLQDMVADHYVSTSNELELLQDDVTTLRTDLDALELRHEGLSNLLIGSYYDKSQADAKFATERQLTMLSSNVTNAYLTAAQTSNQFASEAELASFCNFVAGAYYDKSHSDARFTRLTQYAALSNDLRHNYYDRDVTDAKYAGAVNFAGLSNVLATDYITGANSIDLFASSSNFEQLESNLEADYYTKYETDAGFASATEYSGLSNEVATLYDDFTGLSNLHVKETDEITSNINGVRNDAAGLYLLTNAPFGNVPDNATAASGSNVRFASLSNFTDKTSGLTYTSNVEVMRLDEAGRLGVGVTEPKYRVHVDGKVFATLGYVQESDRNRKADVVPITDALRKVTRIGGYTYRMLASEDEDDDMHCCRGSHGNRVSHNDVDNMMSNALNLKSDADATNRYRPRHAGVIAQEIQEVLPEAVTRSHARRNIRAATATRNATDTTQVTGQNDAQEEEGHEDSNAYTYGVSYADVLALLVESIKELARGVSRYDIVEASSLRVRVDDADGKREKCVRYDFLKPFASARSYTVQITPTFMSDEDEDRGKRGREQDGEHTRFQNAESRPVVSADVIEKTKTHSMIRVIAHDRGVNCGWSGGDVHIDVAIICRRPFSLHDDDALSPDLHSKRDEKEADTVNIEREPLSSQIERHSP